MSEYVIDYRKEATYFIKIAVFPVMWFVLLSSYNYATSEIVSETHVIQSIDKNIIDGGYDIVYIDGVLLKKIHVDDVFDNGNINTIILTYKKYKLSGNELISVEVA